jgi:AcrR family transcriptional regulator
MLDYEGEIRPLRDSMPKSESPAARPYHHGDLPRAIVAAALDLIRETQSVEFSIRELARRAGVSHNAPYKHFADKRELLAAVSAQGFELLTSRMAVVAEGRPAPRARLAAMARDYIRNGVENPALYRLMFGGYLTAPDDGRPAIERAAAFNIRTLLSDAICTGALGSPLPKSAKSERKIDGVILVYWSALHGLTMLLIDGLVGPASKSEQIGQSVWDSIVDGLAAHIPNLPAEAWVGPRPVRQ